MATEIEIVTGLLEILDVSPSANPPEIIEQTTQVIELVSAGPQGPAGRDGALSPEIPVVINGGFF